MKLLQLGDVTEYLEGLSTKDVAKILAHLESLENGLTEELDIKPLKGKIMELTVGQYRIVYFQQKGIIYAVDAFRKKSRKTPKRVIERAEEVYRMVTNIKK